LSWKNATNINISLIYKIIHHKMISFKDHQFISEACDLARQSTMLQRHGCVAVVNGKIIGKGINNYRNYSSDGMISNCCSCHAEIDAMRSAMKKSKVVHRSTKGT